MANAVELCAMCLKVPSKDHSNLCETCSKRYYAEMWGCTEEEFISKFKTAGGA